MFFNIRLLFLISQTMTGICETAKCIIHFKTASRRATNHCNSHRRLRISMFFLLRNIVTRVVSSTFVCDFTASHSAWGFRARVAAKNECVLQFLSLKWHGLWCVGIVFLNKRSWLRLNHLKQKDGKSYSCFFFSFGDCSNTNYGCLWLK